MKKPVITLSNGMEAIMLTENPSKQLGIVDVATIRRLAQMLPSVPFRDIKEAAIEKIRDAQTINELVQVFADEFNFHTTINLLQTYESEPDVETHVRPEKAY